MDIKALQQRKLKHKLGNEKKTSFQRLGLFFQKNISFSNKLSLRIKERFFSEVGMLLAAGVDLQTVLQLAIDGSKESKTLHEIYQLIANKVANGSSISEALESTTRFNNFDCYSILIGENTGELAAVFRKLKEYYSKKITSQRKVTSALSYPIIVLITTVGAVMFMLKLVVPMFAETLKRFGGELPGLTKFVIACSEGMGPFLTYSFILGVIAVFFYYRKRNGSKLKDMLSILALRLPFIGNMLKKIHLSQFTQAMDLLLSSQVGVVESINLTQKMVRFYPLSTALHQVEEDLSKGMFFYKSLEKQQFFDSAFITLVKIGEEVNQLDKIFVQLNKQYESELEYQSNILLTVLEPLMILLLAIIVGVILIAMYLPMFKMGTIIK